MPYGEDMEPAAEEAEERRERGSNSNIAAERRARETEDVPQ